MGYDIWELKEYKSIEKYMENIVCKNNRKMSTQNKEFNIHFWNDVTEGASGQKKVLGQKSDLGKIFFF